MSTWPDIICVREVAKVILGDYLKESYTVHPSVTGTVTFRTIRPIPMKDLLPTLEMLLRQNNAAVVKEEGIYKILPIADRLPDLRAIAFNGGKAAAVPRLHLCAVDAHAVEQQLQVILRVGDRVVLAERRVVRPAGGAELVPHRIRHREVEIGQDHRALRQFADGA